MIMKIFDILKMAVELEASDMHITVGSCPIARVRGNFIKITNKELSKKDIEEIVKEIYLHKKFEKTQLHGECDFSLVFEGTGDRFRVNIYKQKGNYAIAIRIIPSIIPSFDALGLPEILKSFTEKHQGLILVTGPTGSGKSTTLACLIDIINQTQQKHIITVEDPIEYVYQHKNSIVNQREIGQDTESFHSALKSILRQDPDVILIGEMRDAETVSIALTAAETGHLVFSTLHTLGASKTIDRIVNIFPSEQQTQIRNQLSTVCEGVISQQLLQTTNGTRRVAAIEVMIATPAIRNLIRENKTYQIPSMIQTGSKTGMQYMDKELVSLYREGKVSKEIVLNRCNDFEYTNKLFCETQNTQIY